MLREDGVTVPMGRNVYTLLMLFGSCSVLCLQVPAPIDLVLNSHHFIHLLTWREGPESPAGLRYRVIFCSLKSCSNWKKVDGCEAVSPPLQCNLTDVLSEPEETYYINVTAFLGNKTSVPRSYHPFKPAQDTILEPPTLRVSPCNGFLCVDPQSPSSRFDTIYKKLYYSLTVSNEKGDKFLKEFQGLDIVNIKVVQGLQYCMSLDITRYNSSHKPPVCASVPAAVNNKDVVISAFLCLLAPVIFGISSLLFLKYFFCLKSRQPAVLSSFKAPYKVQLLSPPTPAFVTPVSLEPTTCVDSLISEEVDQDKEDTMVAYEGRGGCVNLCEGTSEETSSSLLISPEIQSEPIWDPIPGSTLKEHTLAQDLSSHHCEATTPRATDPSLTTPRNEENSLMHKTGYGVTVQGEEEDCDAVNFFSLILGGQTVKQQEETAITELTEDVKADVPSFSWNTDLQPMCSESRSTYASSSQEEEEEEDTDEEEAFSGYMMRS